VFRVLEPLYLHETEGYWGSAATMANLEYLTRLSGAPSDTVNPNGLAFIIVTAIPFVPYVWTTRTLGAVAYVGLLPCLLYALVLTASRSGLLGLAITFFSIWVQSSRKVVLSLAAIATIAFALPRLTADQLDRYQSIFISDTRNAATAQGRVDGVVADLTVAMRRPLFGHGLGTSAEANANFSGGGQLSHNLVSQVIQELGFVGLLIFGILLMSIAQSVRRALARLTALGTAASPQMVRLGKALQVWFAMNLLFSLFTYGLSNYSWYFLGGLAEVLSRLAGSSAAAPALPARIAQPAWASHRVRALRPQMIGARTRIS
jgi:O-antigen ligase